MPLFEYQCRECDQPFEMFVTGDRQPACPSCGSANLLKLLSRPGMVGTSGSSSQSSSAPASGCRAQGGRCGCH